MVVSSLPFPSNGNVIPISLRFKFMGGTNVTLEGSRDPNSGWVNSHGQKVGDKMLITIKCLPGSTCSGGTSCKNLRYR